MFTTNLEAIRWCWINKAALLPNESDDFIEPAKYCPGPGESDVVTSDSDDESRNAEDADPNEESKSVDHHDQGISQGKLPQVIAPSKADPSTGPQSNSDGVKVGGPIVEDEGEASDGIDGDDFRDSLFPPNNHDFQPPSLKNIKTKSKKTRGKTQKTAGYNSKKPRSNTVKPKPKGPQEG